ncbi:riboflavin synthase [Candidatus Omnitrophota bacterium]
MFTGIIEEIGSITGINKTASGACLKIKGTLVSSDAKLGDSIAINGVCLSVTDIKGTVLNFDVIYETLKRTTLGQLKINDAVNLERSLKLDSRIGGHFVSGHVDYKGKIVDIIKGSEGTGFKISILSEFSRFVAEKGSITIDGISLTIASLTSDSFIVYLIPHTLKNTTLGRKRKSTPVNIELDLLAKYLARQTQKTDLKGLLEKYNYTK